MYPLPAQMRDRWANRPEPPEGQGTVYWHALMARYPEARNAAVTTQTALGQFEGFHLTPADWLHMSVLIAGSTEQVARDQLPNLLAAARSSLTDVSAPAVTLEHLLYHPEAIMLAVEPMDALHDVRRRIDNASSTVTGAPVDHEATARWVPHMTVGYSTAVQPADSIIAAVGTSVPPHQFTVDRITLVVQWGPERRWNWELIGAVQLSTPRHGETSMPAGQAGQTSA